MARRGPKFSIDILCMGDVRVRRMDEKLYEAGGYVQVWVRRGLIAE